MGIPVFPVTESFKISFSKSLEVFLDINQFVKENLFDPKGTNWEQSRGNHWIDTWIDKGFSVLEIPDSFVELISLL